ncbi:GNAT family N-acetyltransferase [Methylomonas sp. BW4-1]|uniref:GNAT family N-acetyltransferase n=1 Tax=Methylomonas sp. BW4-1 TaxID=3376685 RepID=UPI004042614A
MTAFTLIDAAEHDKHFIFNAFKLSMRDYIDWAWGWDDEFQHTGFWRNLQVQNFKLICIGKEPAGAIYVQESEQSHWVRTLFLLPEFQRRGIGSTLLAQEALRAKNLNKKLVLDVIKINPAKRLYDRMGFRVIGEDRALYHMELG